MAGGSRLTPSIDNALTLLDRHLAAFEVAREFADLTAQTVPQDTKSWSEILVSLLTGIPGRGREKGSDLCDGSDVKAANSWAAIDKPRFNGCAPAGRTTAKSAKAADISAYDDMPFLYFVLWDYRIARGEVKIPRCRIWVVDTQRDAEYRAMVASWYSQLASGEIASTNFQLHPPIGDDSNVIRNNCGHLSFPLMLSAEAEGGKYSVLVWNSDAPAGESCVRARRS